MTDETKQKLHDATKKYQIKNPQPSGVDSIRFTGKLVMCNYCGEKVLITNNEDNRHSIAEVLSNSYLISTSGGGIGLSVSNIRPKGDPIGKYGV